MPTASTVIAEVLTIVITFAYSVAHLVWGNTLIGLVFLVPLVFICLALRETLKERSESVYINAFFVCMSFTIILISYYYGVRGLIFIYPLSAGFFYSFRFRTALLSSILLSIACLAAATSIHDSIFILRFAAALCISLSFSAAFAHLIRSQESSLRHEVTHDYLTGLPNRRGFNEHLNTYFLKTTQDHRIWLFFMDLDDFKKINDSYSHLIGDELLQAFGARLHARCENGGYLIRGQFARISGDEFALVICDPPESLTPDLVAKNLISAMVDGFSVSCGYLQISMSIGIATGLNHEIKPVELISRSDASLIQAKKLGKNRFYLFDSLVAENLEKTKLIEIGLRESLERDEFYLVFMPIIHMRDGYLEGVEVLIRSHNEYLKKFSVEEYIKVAESCGLIHKIDRWVINKTIDYIYEWDKTQDPSLTFSINISAFELRDEKFLIFLRELLASTSIHPNRINLEITETAFVDHLQTSVELLESIKKLGVKISLDDFGTGYMGFNQLIQYPVDVLKIDKSFVDEIQKSPARQKLIIDILIDIAHLYRLSVVIEGIEDKLQFDYLKNKDCHYGQGYFIERPLEWVDFFSRYAEQLEPANRHR